MPTLMPVYVHTQLRYPIAAYNGNAIANTVNISGHSQLFNDIPAMSALLTRMPMDHDVVPNFQAGNNNFASDGSQYTRNANHSATSPSAHVVGSCNNNIGHTRAGGISDGYAIDNDVNVLQSHADTENFDWVAFWNMEL